MTPPQPDGPAEPGSVGPAAVPDDVAAAKDALRSLVRERRRARPAADRDAAADALAARALDIPEIVALLKNLDDPRGRGCVAAYASFGTEPGTAPLRATLTAAGVGVLLPVIRDDGGLDWAWDRDDLAAGRVSPGIPEPTGAIAGSGGAGLVANGCVVLLVPALALDPEGCRIGKAGGFYDRLLNELASVAPADRPLTVGVVHDDDVVDRVPVQPHDRTVDAVLTPSRYLDLR